MVYLMFGLRYGSASVNTSKHWYSNNGIPLIVATVNVTKISGLVCLL